MKGEWDGVGVACVCYREWDGVGSEAGGGERGGMVSGMGSEVGSGVWSEVGSGVGSKWEVTWGGAGCRWGGAGRDGYLQWYGG